LPDFRFNPKDAQFLGRPVDFVVFDGLDEGQLRRIVFVEVKTGQSRLTARERLVRDAIRDGRIEWTEIRAGKSADAMRLTPL
jgi:predicted Holliday junction resolvase-like endonuclease